jgi:diketogulonate reductase-like aldo/keto reductase
MDAFYTLSNGYKLPKLGLGTYKLKGEEAYKVVLEALKIGYRHIDSAIIYRNEEEVGRAIRDSGVPREDIFLTSKLPPHIKNKKSAKRMFERSLKNLGLDYLDAYIINAPGPFDDLDGDYDEGNVEVYQFLEELYKEELVGAIGVSQFDVHHIQNILDHCEITPHINQISFFIGHTQDKLVDFCKEHSIQIQAFSPLAKGYLKENEMLNQMAEKYQVSVFQLALAYDIQNGVAPIPKASSDTHLRENFSLNFTIREEDMNLLDQITEDPRKYDD